MSNEPQNTSAPPKTEVQVPDYLKTMQGQSSGDADSLVSASMSIPRISMRAKKFRFIEGGEEILVVNDKIQVHILGVDPSAGLFVKTYYSRPYGGVSDNSPPDCSSDDGLRPLPWVVNKQHPTCQDCPKNKFGSAISRKGGPSKACKDSKRLWVIRADEAHDPKATVYALQVPVMSLKGVAEFGRDMKQRNVPVFAAVCEITMDDDSEFPLITMGCVGYVGQEHFPMLKDRSEKKSWKFEIAQQPALSAPPPVANLPGMPSPGQPQPAAPTTSAPATAEAKPGNVNDVIGSW